MGRPKREYEERGPGEDGTPFQRFEQALRKVIHVPKATLDERERKRKAKEQASH